MTEQAPTIRTAEKDGDGPAKRRRRPALSCVECRSRKVKCDRERPCGACKRIRSTTCSYRPARAGVRDGSPTGTPESASGSNDHEQDHRNSARSSLQYPAPSNEFDVIVNRYVAPGIFGEHGRHNLSTLPVDRPCLDLNSRAKSGESAIITSLLERIRSLETRETSSEGNAANSDLSIRHETGPGQFLKSKYYGQSHWMNAIDPYEALGEQNITVNHNTNRTEVNKKTELYGAVTRIKQMARIIKSARLLTPSITQEVYDSIPPKEICDALVDCYIRTYEGVFRVLHMPSFRKEYEAYWAGTNSEKPSVVLKILLVCAIGVPFYDGYDQPRLRSACGNWVQAAQQWLNGPHAKSRLNMAGLQIQILALLARQVCSIDGDHIWIPAGSLLRAAMLLGLHRDPMHFGKISMYHREMRRRLWATVLEITAQSSLDMGMPPMISSNDYDTLPPSNINDEDIQEGSEMPVDDKPPSEYTDCSIQIAFMSTIPIRLETIRLINNLRFDLSYEDVLKIGSDLNEACLNQTRFFKSALNAGYTVTPFQIKMADSLVRRFVLGLHRPYFAKARQNPQYYYSRKMCLDTSLAIYAPATSDQNDDWTRMTQRCVGFFKSVFLYAMSTIYIELNTQIEEQKSASAIYAPLISLSSSADTRSFALPSQFQTLRDVMLSALRTAEAQIRNGETNAKGVVFMSCAIARIDALVSGADPERAVLEAAKKSVKETSAILPQVYEQEHGVPIDLNVSTTGKDSSRGDGADDVTGRRLQTGTDAILSEDYATVDGGQAMNGNMLEGGMDMLGDGMGGMNGNLGLDAYVVGQNIETMGFGDPNHFARSPEWFYDISGYIGPTSNSWRNGFGGL